MIWIALVLLICCSGAISGSETALFGLPAPTLWKWQSSRSALRRVAYRLMRDPRRVLMTILMANTAVNVAIFAVSYIAQQHISSAHPAIASMIGIACLLAVILFGEILPKAVALARGQALAPPAATIVSFLQTVLTPVQWSMATFLVNPLVHLFTPSRSIGGPVSTEELRRLVDLAAREGAIDLRENSMLQAIIALGHVNVRELMTPRVDLPTVSADMTVADLKLIVPHAPGRKLLVIGADVDDILGVVTARDVFMNNARNVRAVMRPVHVVPEQVDVLQLLRTFQAEGIRGAVVVDEYGGTSGFITVQDVLAQIVGDLPATAGAKKDPPVCQIDENTYELSGQLSARAWGERFGVREIDRRVDTLAGLILWKLGRLAMVGDSVQLRNLTLTVLSMTSKRIDRVRLERAAPGAAPTENPPA